MPCAAAFLASSYRLRDATGRFTMLFLVFHLGADRYAVDAKEVVEVLPAVRLKQIPLAPAWVAGVLSYRTVPVPVIDMSALALGQPAPRRLSTRIILVNYPDRHGVPRLLGLMAEKTTETLRRQRSDFVSPGVSHANARFLGPVAADAHGFVQWVDVNQLLPAQVRDLLFDATVQEGAAASPE